MMFIWLLSIRCTAATDSQAMRVRVTESGSAQADSNYDGAHKNLVSDAILLIDYYQIKLLIFFICNRNMHRGKW